METTLTALRHPSSLLYIRQRAYQFHCSLVAALSVARHSILVHAILISQCDDVEKSEQARASG